MLLSEELTQIRKRRESNVSDVANPKTDEQELFEEIISLLHCFSMRMYSHRRSERKKVEEVINAHDDKC